MALTTFVAGQVLTAAQLNDSYAAVGGLRLIKSQTIGSAVSTVTVSDVFSSTYDNYLVVVNGGVGSTQTSISLQLGSTTTGYYSAGVYVAYNSSAVTGVNSSNGSSWTTGTTSAQTNNMWVTLLNPFASDETTMISLLAETFTTGLALYRTGYLANSTSYTAFTIAPASGTLTGGTIRVYGYANTN